MRKVLLLAVILLLNLSHICSQTVCVSGNCDNGYGVQTYDGGGKYEGNFKGGLRHGQGSYSWSNGDKYIGEWTEGNLTGYGSYTSGNGTVQTGYWENSVYIGEKPKKDCISGNCQDGFGVKLYDGVDKYEGYFRDGHRNGQGTYTWNVGEKYIGEWKDNKITGFGSYTFSDGSVKTGYWENSVYLGTSPSSGNQGSETTTCLSGDCENGYGTKVYSKGGRYEGNFKNSLRDGEGNYVWANGDKYSGHWVADDYTGYGTYTYSGGTSQAGYWFKNEYLGSEPNSSLQGCVSGNCQEGYGINIYDQGRYEGNFRAGFRNGQGTYFWTEGDKYIGEWTDGKLTGMGTYYYKNGTSEFGYWENSKYIGLTRPGQTASTGCISGDCANGTGTYIFDNGDRYEGAFKQNVQDGYGIYNWASGIKYEGLWTAGKQNGEGKTTFKDGYVENGYYTNGKFSGESGTYTDKCISGDCDNGYGIFTWQASGEKYDGNWLNGKRNGQGTNYYANGDVYTGKWLDDKQNGYGSMKFHTGSTYDGDWKMHKEDGFGTFTYSNGEKYIGEWKDAKYNGQGTFYSAGGNSKSGYWQNDQYLGKSNNSTSKTTGCISGNCTDGYAVYVWPSGEKYEGYWAEGKRNGQGSNYFTTGAVYTGEWKADLKHGIGTYKYPAENKDDYYTGNWNNDKINGRGKLVFKDGSRYEGSFHDYYFDGEGSMYNADGTVQSGIWKEGKYSGKSENNYGCISGDCSNGNGTYVFESGEKYIGGFLNSEYSGQGSFYYASGDKYSGEFLKGKREGQGTYTFASDGRKYTGEWKGNKYNGFGIMFYSNGTIKEGNWKDNEYINESATVAKPPVVNWIKPELIASSSPTPTALIKLGIKSSTRLVKIRISVNGNIVSDNATAETAPAGSECDYLLEKSISLMEGENQLKVIVINANGSTSSEVRIINYSTNQGSSDNKFALIIGNSNYSFSVLRNPVNDARGISRELKKLGFKVMLLTNCNRRAMLDSIRSFGEKLSERKGVGLFYYAGHGIEMNGDNYIIPVDARIESDLDVPDETVNLKNVMIELNSAGNETNIIILDACRDNPFLFDTTMTRSIKSQKTRSISSQGNRGLARIHPAPGTLIAYAASPTTVALDGTGENGLYTQELLKALRVPGLKIEDMFKRVRINVYELSNQKQVTCDDSYLFNDFYFNKSINQ